MPSASVSSTTRYLEETTPGTIESGGPQVMRLKEGALTQSTESMEDDEVRNDRGRGDSTLVSGSVGGGFNINYSHKTYDSLLESLLAGTFTEVGTDGVATVSDMTFDVDTHTIGGTGIPVIEKGQWFQISGADDTLNDGIYKASGDTAPTSTAIVVDTTVKDVGADSTSSSTVISSSRLKQGNDTLRTWTIERELTEDNFFMTWKKCYISSLNLSYATGQRVSGTMNAMGASLEETGAVSKFPGISSEVDATTTSSMNSVTGTYVMIDGASLGDSCADSFTLDIQANLRERRCIGSGLAASSVGADPFTITGSSNIFFGSAASKTLLGKKLTDTHITFAICVSDSDGNAFAVTFERAKITTAEISSGGVGTDVIIDFAFQASTDPTFETQICIDRLGSVA